VELQPEPQLKCLVLALALVVKITVGKPTLISYVSLCLPISYLIFLYKLTTTIDITTKHISSFLQFSTLHSMSQRYIQDIPTPKIAGWLEFFFVSWLSPNHPCTANTTEALLLSTLLSFLTVFLLLSHVGGAYHPINLLRVNIAAMGRVLPRVPIMSLELSFAAGAM